MTDKESSLNRQTFRRLLGSVAMFLKSSAGGKARWLLGGLLLLMFCINGMNVANSYVGRYFMSAIESRDMDGFVRLRVVVCGGLRGIDPRRSAFPLHRGTPRTAVAGLADAPHQPSTTSTTGSI
jgi:hypothetical protein